MTLEPNAVGGFAIRLGLPNARRLARAAARKIVAAHRTSHVYLDDDLARRASLGRPVMELLSRSRCSRLARARSSGRILGIAPLEAGLRPPSLRRSSARSAHRAAGDR